MFCSPHFATFPLHSLDDSNRSKKAISAHQHLFVALSGGSVPNLLKKCLADREEIKKQIDFSKWIIFFADERFVPLDHEESNFRANSGWLKEVGVLPENIHKVNTSLASVKEAAEDYEALIGKVVPKQAQLPKFDLMLLGMGPDGHTCSLFPQHKLLEEKKRLVAEIEDSPKPPLQRVTLTLPILNHATTNAFLLQGAAKQKAYDLAVTGQPEVVPSFLVRGHEETLFLLDKDIRAKK